MPPASRSGYAIPIVLAYIERHDSPGPPYIPDYYRRMVADWKVAGEGIAPLGAVDAILMKLGHAIYQLEMWAQEEYGWDGFVDPRADPASLVG